MTPDEYPSDLLLSHAALVRRVATALVGDTRAADDVIQETWIAAVSETYTIDVDAADIRVRR